MRLIFHVILLSVALAQTRTESKQRPFLDQTKSVVSQLEWNREVVAKKPGAIRFAIDSQGPFSVTIVADRSYKAILARDKNGFHKSDVLLTKDYKGPSCEGTVNLPSGSSWFIIGNHMSKSAKLHLRCWSK